VLGPKSLRDHISVSYSAAESGAFGSAAFGFLALLLATSGIYGVISYGVAQRKREIGIRMALGARWADVVHLVLGRGLRLAALGISAGLVLALIVSRSLSGILYGVSPNDPVTFVSVALLLAAVSLVASLLPAVRAARLEPTETLRA
jgi:ABC-type antimicrobial peptide transport system permease subunit